jgi:hypothetical protein
MARKTIRVEEKVPFLQGIPLSFQHLFAMFGASVLVPTLFKIDPAVVLFMNGVGTLIYLVLCKGRAPAFLGSSFAFQSPVFVVLGANQAVWGQNYPWPWGSSPRPDLYGRGADHLEIRGRVDRFRPAPATMAHRGPDRPGAGRRATNMAGFAPTPRARTT